MIIVHRRYEETTKAMFSSPPFLLFCTEAVAVGECFLRRDLLYEAHMGKALNPIQRVKLDRMA